MLASLTIFNLAHADKCVDFLLSDNDKRQWKVQIIYFPSLLKRGQTFYSQSPQIEANSELRWPLYETMLEKTPGSLKTKQEMMQVERFFKLSFRIIQKTKTKTGGEGSVFQTQIDNCEACEEAPEPDLHRPDRAHDHGSPSSLPC